MPSLAVEYTAPIRPHSFTFEGVFTGVNLFEGRIGLFPSPFLIFLRGEWLKKPQTFPDFNLF